MKIRIRGNSLRFRLGKTEVEAFGVNGHIEESVNFGPGGSNDFSYRLEAVPGVEFSGTFIDGRITVRVPETLVSAWATSAQVSLEGKQVLDDQRELTFLIEKDFACLDPHDGEDQSDTFPNPQDGSAC
jgi:hypothetical protein